MKQDIPERNVKKKGENIRGRNEGNLEGEEVKTVEIRAVCLPVGSTGPEFSFSAQLFSISRHMGPKIN